VSAKRNRGRRRRRRSNKRERQRRLRWLSLAFALLVALVWAAFGGEIRELIGLAGDGPPRRGEALRVVSWNLANFEGDASGHDLPRILEVLEQLDPDVLAMQEIKDPEALAALLSGWELLVSDKGGRGRQRLAIAWRRDRVELLATAEHPELSLGGRVRPALSAYLRGREGGPDFWLINVHLKAMPDSLDVRREQWPLLVEIAEATVREPSVGQGDRDLLIVGDFNSTGPRGTYSAGPAIEQAEIAELFAGVGLRRLRNATGCSAYYDGRRRDAWKEPSEIDLIWVRELHESISADAQVFSGTHCAASSCREFRSTQAYPVNDYVSVSDHCPVVVDLVRADDD
jgi:endonuclease/exonuclease/phosphatase family metal-dependent hydrolase